MLPAFSKPKSPKTNLKKPSLTPLHNKIGKPQPIFSTKLPMPPTIMKNGNKSMTSSGTSSKRVKAGRKFLRHSTWYNSSWRMDHQASSLHSSTTFINSALSTTFLITTMESIVDNLLEKELRWLLIYWAMKNCWKKRE